MKAKLLIPILIFCLSLLLDLSCKSKATATETDAAPVVRTPVTVTHVTFDAMEDFVMLNATSTYLQKSIVKSNATGYITSSNIKLYSFVNSGQILFSVKTKEATSIGNTINKLDPSFHFSGVNSIHSNKRGCITELTHQTGDYVQDNEQLAVISDMNSFVFLLDLPYELRRYVTDNKTVEITLPDGERITGTVGGNMPMMDSVSQTQGVVIRPAISHSLPQNLIAKVKIIKNSKPAAISLPKEAVLTDETQNAYWVMKLIDDSTAVKVPVKKGIETKDKIEILTPAFNPADRILISGNYGLTDTAKIIVQPSTSGN